MERFNDFPNNELIDIPFGGKYAWSNNLVRVAMSRLASSKEWGEHLEGVFQAVLARQAILGSLPYYFVS